MIPPFPNFGFSFFALPAWQWLPAADSVAGPAGDADGAGPDDSAGEGAPADMRLMFKGYEWRAAAQWYPVVDPAWEHYADNDPEQIRERELRHERERQQAQQSAATRAQRGEAPARPDDAAGAAPSWEAPQWYGTAATAMLDPKRTRP